MKPEDRPKTPERPKITLPDWWLDTAKTLGPLLGGQGPEGLATSLDAFASLDLEEREAYMAILAFRQLYATAELGMFVRNLERTIQRGIGLSRVQAEKLHELLTPPPDEVDDEAGDDEDDAGEDPGEPGDDGGEGGDEETRLRRQIAELEAAQAAPKPRKRKAPAKVTGSGPGNAATTGEPA